MYRYKYLGDRFWLNFPRRIPARQRLGGTGGGGERGCSRPQQSNADLGRGARSGSGWKLPFWCFIEMEQTEVLSVFLWFSKVLTIGFRSEIT